jgi:hypothetical protein
MPLTAADPAPAAPTTALVPAMLVAPVLGAELDPPQLIAIGSNNNDAEIRIANRS